jgi:hypothetical protein
MNWDGWLSPSTIWPCCWRGGILKAGMPVLFVIHHKDEFKFAIFHLLFLQAVIHGQECPGISHQISSIESDPL